MSLEAMPRELWPTWASIDPPSIDEVRRGVVYTGLDPEHVLEILADAGAYSLASCWAAVGRLTQWGRADGPWVPYDVTKIDQNLRIPVHARPWPWSIGDGAWALINWSNQPTFLGLDPDGCSIAVWAPEGPIAFRGAFDAVYDAASTQSDGCARMVSPLVFWPAAGSDAERELRRRAARRARLRR